MSYRKNLKHGGKGINEKLVFPKATVNNFLFVLGKFICIYHWCVCERERQRLTEIEYSVPGIALGALQKIALVFLFYI